MKNHSAGKNQKRLTFEIQKSIVDKRKNAKVFYGRSWFDFQMDKKNMVASA